MAVFEERRTSLRRASVQQYLRLCREESLPALQGLGGRLLCLLSPIIGAPATDVVQIAELPDVEAWEKAQSILPTARGELIEAESVRLLRAVSSRPKTSLPADDRRSVYGLRSFFIRPSDLDEFVLCSERGLWPRIEAQGACILGMFATAARTDPLEVVLVTGYHGPGHWEETRGNVPMPEGFDKALWDESTRLSNRRNEMTLKSWVVLTRALALDGALG